jgi:hypothetical protein
MSTDFCVELYTDPIPLLSHKNVHDQGSLCSTQTLSYYRITWGVSFFTKSGTLTHKNVSQKLAACVVLFIRTFT